MKWFALNDASDLFAKLQRDHQALQDNPDSTDHAFDFFVTAWHLLDWKYPDSVPGNRAKRAALRDTVPLLQVLDHLANGLKHSHLTRPQHQSISKTTLVASGTYYSSPDAYYGAAYWGGGPDRLVIKLIGQAGTTFGDTITASDLAVKVMDFWTAEMQRP